MKALLDEQLSPRIAELLRNRGQDVQAVADRDDLAGQSDRMILDAAAAEDRAVITNNVKDFRPLAAERLAQGASHAGLILLPSTRTRTPRRCGDARRRDRGHSPQVSRRPPHHRAVGPADIEPMRLERTHPVLTIATPDAR